MLTIINANAGQVKIDEGMISYDKNVAIAIGKFHVIFEK